MTDRPTEWIEKNDRERLTRQNRTDRLKRQKRDRLKRQKTDRQTQQIDQDSQTNTYIAKDLKTD